MKIINIYEYSIIYYNKDVISSYDSVRNLISGIKSSSSDNSIDSTVYGVVEDAYDVISSYAKLMLITPMSYAHDNVEDTIVLNRNQIRRLMGIDMVNPKKMRWSINILNERLEDISSNKWYDILNKMNSIDSNYVLMSCNNNINWLKLTDVKNNLMLVPNVDNMNLYNSSRVGLMDTLYQEVSRLIDFRHMTANDTDVNKHYSNN